MLIYKKWGLFIIRQMQRYLEDMLEAAGHEPTLFPVLISEDTLGKETAHIAGFEEEVFWVTHAGANELERRLALRPTSETPIYEMFHLWIRSHMDLPLKVHQSCAVYRYETKHTRPLIRGREFLWNEGHSAHIDDADAKKNIAEVQGIYGRLIKDLLCLPYMIDKRPDWDRFPGAVSTYAFDTIMPDGKTLQIATVHDLGQNFSKVFDITFDDVEGIKHHVFQTSYGPSFGRLLAAAMIIHGDDKGLVLPPKVAPVQAIVVPIVFKESEKREITEYAEKVKEKLAALGVRVEVDAGDDRPGAKFFYWEMKGVPVRVEAGPRDLKDSKVTVVRRDNGEKKQIEFAKMDEVLELFDYIAESMRNKAATEFEKKLLSAKSLDEAASRVGEGVVLAGWCGKDVCSDAIKERSDVLCVGEKPASCIVCGGKGKDIRLAKTY
jgi:prolyl-tRNA synthetase